MRIRAFPGIILVVLVSSTILVQPLHGQQKTIKDPLEYNQYIAALNTPDAAQKAASMEAFIAKYPNSVAKVDAMEQAMGAYQQAGNAGKVEEMAESILQLYPDNLRALSIAVYLRRVRAGAGDAKAGTEAGTMAERGLRLLPAWTKPEGMSDVDFKKITVQISVILNGAAGFARLLAKDYTNARPYYLEVFRLEPGSLQDVYQLSIACLETTPLSVDGFWYVAKAMSIAKSQSNEKGFNAMNAYGKAKYRRFHGGDDGWDAIVTAAASQVSLPAGFTASIKPKPTPAEIAVQALADNDPASLSFADYEFVLMYRDASAANKQAADRVWQAIQAKQKSGTVKLQLPVKVISSTTTTILAAITEDNQSSGTADIEITMDAPMPTPPAPGAQITVIGVLTEYTLSPFMFKMKHGSLR